MANLVPALVFVPIFATGIMLFQSGRPTYAVICFGLSIIFGLFAVNLLGLFQNRRMRAELKPLVHGRTEPLWFVGIGKPGAFGTLDPHEDMGFLLFTSNGIEFIGEMAHYQIPYVDIFVVSFKMNAHSLLGLGRWVAIEGRHEGRKFRLLVEPRTHPTLLQNKREGARLAAELRKLLPAKTA
jgi:hypothetical protein